MARSPTPSPEPRRSWFDQKKARHARAALQRLLSREVTTDVVEAGSWFVCGPLALFTAVVLYAHILGDLVWDNDVLGTYREQHHGSHIHV